MQTSVPIQDKMVYTQWGKKICLKCGKPLYALLRHEPPAARGGKVDTQA